MRKREVEEEEGIEFSLRIPVILPREMTSRIV